MQSYYKNKSELQNPEGKNFTVGIVSAWWNRTRHQWQCAHQDPEHLQHSGCEHWHVSAQFSCFLVRFVSSWFAHCTAWLKGVAHVISSMHEVCGSLSTLSPTFSSTYSSSHSSFISCISSCISSTTLRDVVSLCTPPNKVWTLLNTLTSSQVMSPTPTTSRKLTSSPTQSPWPPPPPHPHTQFSKQGFFKNVEYDDTALEDMPREAQSTWLSLSARRLVCRSVVVVHVRANGATCWRANGAVCWTNWSGAKCCKCTD